MSVSRSPRLLRVLSLALLTVSTPALARVPAGSGPATVAIQPIPVRPAANERASEANARFEVTSAAGARDVRIIVSQVPFDPTGWTSLPTGPTWTILEWKGTALPLGRLGLAGRTDTPLWWAVVWTDRQTGGQRASDALPFTLIPRFANRVAADATVRPTTVGRLTLAVPSLDAPRRPIELAAGYTVVPGGPAPEIPASLGRIAAPSDDVPASGRAAYLVQFADGAAAAASARIQAAGGTIVAPLAGAGYLVRMDAAAKAKLAGAQGRPWIGDFAPAYKLSSDLEPTKTGTVEVTALLFDDGDAATTAAALRTLGAGKVETHKGSGSLIARFELDRSRLAEAAALADVQWMEPTPRYTTSNDLAQWVVQSGVPNSRPVWDHGLRGQGQVVMVGDSGIRTNHEAFYDSTQAINGWGDYPTHRKIIAYKPGSLDPKVEFGDDVGHSYHGTHTDGTVAGNPTPFSNAPWSGMAKDARLYFMDLGGSADAGLYIYDDLGDFFQPSYTGNPGGAARISSNSWGSSQSVNHYTITAMTLDRFVWTHPDYLVAFAAGNYGFFNAVQSPGTSKNCLTVGATGNGTDQNKLANFSSRGPTYDGRRKPTVMGPGDLVTSSVGNTRYTYAAYSGTSMSTPAVAGAMALVRQYLTEGSYPTGVPVAANAINPSAALMRAIAVASARNDIISNTAPNNTIGYGRVTLDDVLYFPGDTRRTLLVDTKDGLEDQQFLEYQVQVTDPAQELKIALCWSDAPASPAAQIPLVNDLDLVVTNGAVSYRGNALLNYVSAPNGPRDSLNVEELVRLPTPSAGTWTVRVEGHRIASGPQPFALCITGGVGGSNGAVALDRFDYGLTDTLAIEVVDANASGTLTVQASSTSEPFQQAVKLTGANGVFRGSLPLAPAAIRLNDGVLAVSTGDLVTVTYADASTGAQVAATARINVKAPTITNVHAVALSGSQAVVSWTTDVAGSSRVRFGTSAPVTVADSSGFTMQHSVLLTGLSTLTAYKYDVESVTPDGEVVRDSLGGAHRTFTTKRRGSIALLMDDPEPTVLTTWINAFAALGWDVDVLPAALNDPPLVGNSSAGLRSYQAVLWQVGPDNYPPFSDAQRAAIDSLMDGGGRLLVTGHDIGFGLADAGSPVYSEERELWLEHTLKSRYFIDNLYADTLIGIPASPISGPGRIYYPAYSTWPDAGDNFGAAPGHDGTWSPDWTDNWVGQAYIGMHWDSDVPRGTPGVGIWGGKDSRLVGMFYEWAALAGLSTANLDARTGVLARSVSYLLGHNPPDVRIVSPAPGAVVTGDFLPIAFSLKPDAGRAIASRAIDYSLDGGETWTQIASIACADSSCIWDLGAALGGTPIPNSARARLRMRVADDGTPSLVTSSTMSGVFTIARGSGDARGPIVVAGSQGTSPMPLRGGDPASLFASVSDAETGGGTVAAAEYSLGAVAAPAGSGIAMTGVFGTSTVQAGATLNTNAVPTGTQTLWVRGRDAAGNWGPAAGLTVPSVSKGVVAVEDEVKIDFLATPSPNPFQGTTSVRFGLARAARVRLELFDLAGRRVRTLVDGDLEAGAHATTWDGRDERGASVRAGIYFVRFIAPGKTLNARVVSL